MHNKIVSKNNPTLFQMIQAVAVVATGYERPTTPFLGITSAQSQFCYGSSATMGVTLPTSAWTPFARMTDYPAIAELAWTNFGCCFKGKDV
jgi:hypothetical protein